ncbi:protein kinase domain-containing protein [Stygiolobus caldivivus]|uniref:Protein kinase domain-containing protein n=1 Tax=Stygiolobus caldivivus TaxID=2824673 RepID=A0A8D5U3R1_9CREN|nr:tetratricopeptide repeat protein [Stygiolobus caldivivus]BCU68704.1 hypothetical protein KN1_00010 [Stygiolobus caldivivus]
MSSLRSLLSQGRQLYDNRDYEGAYKIFNRAHKLSPDNEEVVLWKGKTQFKLGKLKTAMNTLSLLVKDYNPDSWEGLFYLSKATYHYSFFLTNRSSRTKNLKSALWYSERAYLASRRNKSEIASLRAIILSDLGQLGEAEKVLIPFLKSNTSNPYVGTALAHIKRLKGSSVEALYEVDKTLLYYPGDVDALTERSLALRDKGDYSEALNTLDIVLRLEPTNVLAMLFKAEALELTGRVGEALKVYKQINAIFTNPLVKKKLSTAPAPLVPSISPAPPPQQMPSKPLSPVKPLSWDPKAWLGRKFSIYEVTDVLGEGGNGYVLKAKTRKGEVAVKVLKVYSGLPEEHFDALVNEVNSLSKLSNDPNVVGVYAVYVDKLILEDILSGNSKLYKEDPPRIVMEYMKGGNMAELTRDDKFFYSSQWNKAVYTAALSVTEALYQLHRLGFVHMDVKPQNIFLTEKPRYPYELTNVKFKLGDLGSVVRVNGKVTQVTVEYASPEVYVETAKPYFDIFSLGMTMYVLLTRKLDRPDMSEMNDAFDCYQRKDLGCVRDRVRKAQEKLRNWDPNVPPEVKPLVKSMLSPEPVKRPTSLEVHKYLSNLVK